MATLVQRIAAALERQLAELRQQNAAIHDVVGAAPSGEESP
jgi:hypothetical protein